RITSIPSPRAFGIPVYYYWQFMEDNRFHDRVKALLEDESFQDSAQDRDEQLETLRDDMIAAPLNEAFMELLEAKLRADYDGVRMRFRSSTNAEDLEGFTGAGLYTSKSGELDSEKDPVWDAIREVWASVWFFRAFEERSYR